MASKGDKQRRRALEAVQTGLSRRDPERAVAALLELPGPEREALLASVAELVRGAILEAHRHGDWARGPFWCARFEREPRLIEAGGSPEERDEALWALFWGCVRSRELKRAGSLLDRLAPRLPGGLAAALRATVDGAGCPPAAVISALVPAEEEPVADPRLGYDRGQVASAASALRPAAPTSEDEVEAAVLGLRAALGWGDFEAEIGRWVASRPKLERRILLAAARLAVGELLDRVEAKTSPAAPAQLIASASNRLGAPSELAAELLLAFRLGAPKIGPEPMGREQARKLGPLLIALARHEAYRSAAFSLAARARFAPEAESAGLALFEELLRVPGSEPVALRALVTWQAERYELDRVPNWLVAGVERLVQAPQALAEALSSFVERDYDLAFARSPLLLPRALVESLVDLAWEKVEGRCRGALVDAVTALLETESGPRSWEDTGEGLAESSLTREQIIASARALGLPELSRADIDAILADVEVPSGLAALGRIAAAQPGDLVSPAGMRTLERFAERVARLDGELFSMAMEAFQADPERRARVLEARLGDRTLDECVREAVDAHDAGALAAMEAVIARVLATAAGDAEKLAGAIRAALAADADTCVLGPLSRAFNDADAQSSGKATVEIEAVRRVARRYDERTKATRGRAKSAGRRRKPVKAAKVPGAKGAKPSAKSGKAAKPPEAKTATRPQRPPTTRGSEGGRAGESSKAAEASLEADAGDGAQKKEQAKPARSRRRRPEQLGLPLFGSGEKT